MHTHRNLLLVIQIHTGTSSWVSWCISSSSYTYTLEPTLGYPGAALFQAMHTHRNLLLGIMVKLSFKLYIHTGNYFWVSWCSSLSSYTYTQEPRYSWVSWCNSLSTHTYTEEPTLVYPGAVLFQAIHKHRNLLMGILVQQYFQLYLHTGTYSLVSWCSSLSSYTYTQEPTLGYPGAALFQTKHTHRNLLLVILVQLSFKL